jgi:two-component system, LytTR family, response regulator AgrA
MLSIIICEDDDIQRKAIEAIINEEILNSNLELNINLSTKKPEDVIKHVEASKGSTFIYFLDVEFEGAMNGIELAKRIRKFDSKGYIIFVTSHSELTLLTFHYKVQAMDYIVKYDSKEMQDRIVECINEAYNDYKNYNIKEGNIIPISIGNRVVYFNIDEILFFETTNKDHRIRIHTCDEQLEFYGTLKDIEKSVSENYYKPHRSYLVNIKKIKSIDKDKLIIHMINGEVCYIASRYLRGLLNICSI